MLKKQVSNFDIEIVSKNFITTDSTLYEIDLFHSINEPYYIEKVDHYNNVSDIELKTIFLYKNMIRTQLHKIYTIEVKKDKCKYIIISNSNNGFYLVLNKYAYETLLKNKSYPLTKSNEIYQPSIIKVKKNIVNIY